MTTYRIFTRWQLQPVLASIFINKNKHLQYKTVSTINRSGGLEQWKIDCLTGISSGISLIFEFTVLTVNSSKIIIIKYRIQAASAAFLLCTGCTVCCRCMDLGTPFEGCAQEQLFKTGCFPIQSELVKSRY